MNEPDARGGTLGDAWGERRQRRDRRHNHAKAFLVQFIKPRRRSSVRRKMDTHGFPVDHHGPQVLAVVLIILTLCVVDVYATLTLLQLGGVELNPLMDKLIRIDVWTFFVSKYALTAVCLLVLVSYKRFRVYRSFSAMHTLYAVMTLYCGLVIYQIGLLSTAAG